MRWALTYLLFPVTFAMAIAVAVVAVGRDWSIELTLASITLATIVIVGIAERVHPRFRAWNRSHGDVGTDAAHAAVSMVALPKIVEIGLHAGLLGVAAALARRAGGSLWPTEANLGLQLALAMLISQFFEYWWHRLAHEVPLLWRLHATHHSPARLYWLNAARFHPLDSAFNYALSSGPLILLGAGPDILFLVAVWIAVHGLFQHCNVDLRLGPLNYLFSMAELHRWHHSLKLEEANANYGNNILLWDLVFRTVYYPKDRTAAETIGLSDMDDFPQDYVGQVLSPIRWLW